VPLALGAIVDSRVSQVSGNALRRTLHIASQPIGLLDQNLYMVSPADILSVLRTVRETKAGTVMMVGHNPGLEELVAQLAGDRQDLPTAALAQIVLRIDEWRDFTRRPSRRSAAVRRSRPQRDEDRYHRREAY